MKVIQVKFISATNTKLARVKATAEGVTPITRQYEFDSDRSAFSAAFELAKLHDWQGIWVAGGLPDGSTAFVCLGRNVPSPYGIGADRCFVVLARRVAA